MIQTLALVTIINAQVETLLSLMEELSTDYLAWSANNSSYILSSGPLNGLPPGSILSCPTTSAWDYNILLGNSNSDMALNTAIYDLTSSIQGASTQTGVNLVAQIFNSVSSGSACTNNGCDTSGQYYTSLASGPVPLASPVNLVVSVLNQYVATMIQG